LLTNSEYEERFFVKAKYSHQVDNHWRRETASLYAAEAKARSLSRFLSHDQRWASGGTIKRVPVIGNIDTSDVTVEFGKRLRGEPTFPTKTENTHSIG
jgi:hypothetical protein